LISQEELLAKPPSRWDLRAIYRIEKLKKFQPVNDEARHMTRQITSMSVTSAKSFEEGGAAVSDAKYVLNELEEIYKIILPSHMLTSQVSESQFMRANSEDLANVQKRQRLLLSLAGVCLKFDEVNVCSQILGYLKESDLAVSIWLNC